MNSPNCITPALWSMLDGLQLDSSSRLSTLRGSHLMKTLIEPMLRAPWCLRYKPFGAPGRWRPIDTPLGKVPNGGHVRAWIMGPADILYCFREKGSKGFITGHQAGLVLFDERLKINGRDSDLFSKHNEYELCWLAPNTLALDVMCHRGSCQRTIIDLHTRVCSVFVPKVPQMVCLRKRRSGNNEQTIGAVRHDKVDQDPAQDLPLAVFDYDSYRTMLDERDYSRLACICIEGASWRSLNFLVVDPAAAELSLLCGFSVQKKPARAIGMVIDPIGTAVIIDKLGQINIYHTSMPCLIASFLPTGGDFASGPAKGLQVSYGGQLVTYTPDSDSFQIYVLEE